MTTKCVRSSEQFHFPATAAHSSGDVVVVGDTIGIAASDAAIGDEAILGVLGTYGPMVAKGTDVIAVGVDLYWDATPGEFTLTATANVYAGKAATASGNGVLSVDVTFGLPEAA